MESGKIPDAAITSSSDWNAGHRAVNGRLNFHAGKGRTGAWSAKVNDRGQFLEVDLGRVAKVTRMATQGRQDADQWVTSYTLSYSTSYGGYFYPYNNGQVTTFPVLPVQQYDNKQRLLLFLLSLSFRQKLLPFLTS